mmetsp:Transcript_34074/g.73800  ORF Transcript_34074/g.73800 Transcript_34074/m.73800 type:complete len:105 (-) Transcript_34074:101-415(-)
MVGVAMEVDEKSKTADPLSKEEADVLEKEGSEDVDDPGESSLPFYPSCPVLSCHRQQQQQQQEVSLQSQDVLHDNNNLSLSLTPSAERPRSPSLPSNARTSSSN